MNKKNLIAAFAATAAIIFLSGCGNQQSTSNGTNQQAPATPDSSMPSSMPVPNTQPPTASTQDQAGGAVTVKNFAFSPIDLTVAKGTTVIWTNQDSVSHQIASDPGDAVSFSGPAMPQGQSFSFKFDTTGTFPYHCVIHPSMHGTITVK